MKSEDGTFTWLPLVKLVLRLAWGGWCSGVPLPLASLLLPHQSLLTEFLHTPLSFLSSLSSPPPLHRGNPCFSPICMSMAPKSYSLTRHGVTQGLITVIFYIKVRREESCAPVYALTIPGHAAAFSHECPVSTCIMTFSFSTQDAQTILR